MHVWQSVAENDERTRQWSGTENRGTEKKKVHVVEASQVLI